MAWNLVYFLDILSFLSVRTFDSEISCNNTELMYLYDMVIVSTYILDMVIVSTYILTLVYILYYDLKLLRRHKIASHVGLSYDCKSN